ncbi:protein MIZU-KUSSEI 1-like [Canna indica]|uniref:Protein MIZU-KUSSEI 1-like n=1 Tax=Canna indica TaxID=4628 RepID=A0AAQ3K3A7_9LILI|nr:protein MIZU-KUSSEI 1-like [Canna indica]
MQPLGEHRNASGRRGVRWVQATRPCLLSELWRRSPALEDATHLHAVYVLQSSSCSSNKITSRTNQSTFLSSSFSNSPHFLMSRSTGVSSSSGILHFNWSFKRCPNGGREANSDDDDKATSTTTTTTTTSSSLIFPYRELGVAAIVPKKIATATDAAVSRLRAALASGRRNRVPGLGVRVTGTLYGQRRGHVHLAFQADGKSHPVVLVELATATSALVREMASGLVRIALECDRRGGEKAAAARLAEEPLWRAYVNGRKSGYAVQRECGPGDWKVLRAVEPVSMGAGVIPSGGAGGADKDVMYMRARFERVVGSKDSEAFYMMNPDSINGGPELSVYLLRV